MKPVKQGARHQQLFHPAPEHMASSMGNHGVDVVATTALILYFEAAANNLALPFYEADEISVGTHVNIDHLAPAWASKSVQVTAELTLQQGRRLEFELVATQDDKVVMRGQHHRAVMSRQRFGDAESNLDVPASDTSSAIDFWFDFHSPWCYFAAHQIVDIAQQTNAKINWKPVHLANLSTAIDGRRPLEANSNFVRWYEGDQLDTAAMMGLPFEPHKDYPKRPSRALRAAIYANEQNLAAPFVQQVMQGYWSAQQDISDLDWLAEVAGNVGLDQAELLAATADEQYKLQLGQHLDQAVTIKLFGLPASVVNGKIFWGNDRLPLLQHYLSGRPPHL